MVEEYEAIDENFGGVEEENAYAFNFKKNGNPKTSNACKKKKKERD